MNSQDLSKWYTEVISSGGEEATDIYDFMSCYGREFADEALHFYYLYHNNSKIMSIIRQYFTAADFGYLLVALSDSKYRSVDLADQFYSFFELREKENDNYYRFYELMRKNFSLNQNILEIGSGMVPSLARYIGKYQQENGQGTITCYDQNAIIKKANNIVIVPENIDYHTDLDNYDLLCSYNLCHAAELFVDLADRSEKEFILATCNCVRDYPYDFEVVFKNINDRKFMQLLEEVLDTMQVQVRDRHIKALNSDFTYAFGLDYRIYSLYLYRKLCLKNNPSFSYKLQMIDNRQPVIIKKKI